MKAKHLLFTFGLLFAALAKGLAQPVINSQPQDQTNVLGTTATFSVTATGTSPPSYQWAFGSPLADLDAATNTTLVLPNVQLTNQGPYEVVVTNLEGSVTSVVANLYVVAPPLLQFAANSYTVAESAGSAVLTVKRTLSLGTTVNVDYATVDGSATNGVKYMAVSGTLIFGPSETNKAIAVPVLNDGFVGTKYFRVILSNPTGGAVLGGSANATVNITDNDVGIQFQFATNSAAEDAGAVLIGIVRGDDGTLPVTVTFATTDWTAANGVDYIGKSNTLSFAPQERLKLVAVPILNNGLKQPNRSFMLNLANSTGASLGSQRTATVTIVDNDQGFQFELPSHTVAQEAGVARIVVLRGTDDTKSPATVDFATANVTAVNGVDYTGTTNTLLFAPGEKVKPVTIPLLNDGLKKGTRYFRAALSNPTGGAGLASPTTTSVFILNSNPGLGFELSSYSVWENAGAITLPVLRGNAAALGPITVDYATSDGTAKAGQDYQEKSGTLALQPNETVKGLTIPILLTNAIRGTRSFRVTLTNPTGGATLGTASASAKILGTGAYFTVAPSADNALAIHQEGSLNLLTWNGGGHLQRADSPLGPWQTLTSATNPYAVQPPLPTSFYRVTRPRPAEVYIPSSYDGKNPVPLVILLHGYGGTGSGQESYMQIQPLAESRGFLYCYPDGTTDKWGNPFWNATDASAGFGYTGVDDAGYLHGLIEEIGGKFAVDRKRIYLIGHSNGGFMVYRMACQFSSLVAAIASLAGGTFLDPSQCTPIEPVSILHIHGTADDIVPYAGGAVTTAVGFLWNTPAFPGALRDVQTWAVYNGASGPVSDPAPSLDLTTDKTGLDTVITRYTNSPPGGAVELWTINGGSHSPTLSSQFSPLVIDWLLAHPKP